MRRPVCVISIFTEAGRRIERERIKGERERGDSDQKERARGQKPILISGVLWHTDDDDDAVESLETRPRR